MTSTTPAVDTLYAPWVRATTLGWLLGLVLLAVLALIADMVHLGESGGQFMVGLGIGWGVGYLQGRALTPWMPRRSRWMLASAVGMGGLFVVHDVVRAARRAFPYSLPLYVLAGALFVGLWQSALLRPVSTRAAWWVPASVLAWALPAGGIALSDAERGGMPGALASLASIFLGGLMVGLVSGGALVWILRQRAA